MAKAYLTVRAQVPETERDRFDHWYETDHLPWALRAFGVPRASRCWSRTAPSVHLAIYEFESAEAAQTVVNSDVIKPLIADFDRVWGNRVPRHREIIEVVQELIA